MPCSAKEPGLLREMADFRAGTEKGQFENFFCTKRQDVLKEQRGQQRAQSQHEVALTSQIWGSLSVITKTVID